MKATSGFVTAAAATLAVAEAGLQWTKLADAPWSARSFPCAGEVNGQLVITGGHNDEGYTNDVWSSPDGENWRLEVAQAPWTPRSYHSCEVLPGPDGPNGDRMILMGGHSQNDWFGDVWISEPGNVSSWSLVLDEAPWAARAAASLMRQGASSLVLLGGSDGYMQPLGDGTLFNDVWRSDDAGRTWNEEANAAPWVAREGMSGGTGLTFGGNVTVIGGETGYFEDAFLGDVWSSATGGAGDWKQHTQLAEFSVGGYGRTGHVVAKQTTTKAGSMEEEVLWLAGGFLSLSDVWCTSDLDEPWIMAEASSPWPGRYDMIMRTFQGRLVVMAGEDSPQGFGGPFFNDVWAAELPDGCSV